MPPPGYFRRTYKRPTENFGATIPGLPQEEVPNAIEAIVDQYLRVRQQGERFLDTYRRIGIAPFKEAVYGSAAGREVA